MKSHIFKPVNKANMLKADNNLAIATAYAESKNYSLIDCGLYIHGYYQELEEAWGIIISANRQVVHFRLWDGVADLNIELDVPPEDVRKTFNFLDEICTNLNEKLLEAKA